MTDTPATQPDTSGVVGNSGHAAGGTAHQGSNRDTENVGPGAGGVPDPDAPAATQPDTSGTNSPNVSHTPVSTLVTGTIDTASGEGNAVRHANPTYRAPGAIAAGSNRNTDLTDQQGVGTAPDEASTLYGGTVETANFGAARASARTTQEITLNTSGPAVVPQAGALFPQPTAVVVRNKGQVIAVADESHAAGDPLEAFTLTNAGVTSAVTEVVVKKGSTVLVRDTDYEIEATGSAGTRNMEITPLDSATVSAGDTLLVSYSYGNAKYHTPANLTVTTDYTLSYTGEGANTRLRVLRVNTAASSNGDKADVTFSYGDSAYWGSNIPAAVPAAPTIGTPVARNRAVLVKWTRAAEQVNTDGFVIQCVPGLGTLYAGADAVEKLFHQVTAGMPYKFRVAGYNARGQGAWSSLSAEVTPLNTDAVPTGQLAPENTINPVYLPDGSVKSGTGLGPS